MANLEVVRIGPDLRVSCEICKFQNATPVTS
jgi:hypothetical protein